MDWAVSHSRDEESIAAKVAWFQSLTLEERMELLCEFTDLALENNPSIAEVNRAEPAPGRIRVLTLPQS